MIWKINQSFFKTNRQSGDQEFGNEEDKYFTDVAERRVNKENLPTMLWYGSNVLLCRQGEQTKITFANNCVAGMDKLAG